MSTNFTKVTICFYNEIMEKIRKIGISKLARALGLTHGAIVNWFARGQIPAEWVLRIVRATEGSITPHDLRPDLYPDKDWLPSGLNRAT
ncbi:transcriptional repressor of cell division inhibition gene dicB [Gammaproteobacteria bacterium]